MQQLALLGDPDYLLCINGKFVGLELKSEGGKATKLQLEKHEGIRRAGGIVFVAEPANWEEIKVQLQELADGKK